MKSKDYRYKKPQNKHKIIKAKMKTDNIKTDLKYELKL